MDVPERIVGKEEKWILTISPRDAELVVLISVRGVRKRKRNPPRQIYLETNHMLFTNIFFTLMFGVNVASYLQLRCTFSKLVVEGTGFFGYLICLTRTRRARKLLV